MALFGFTGQRQRPVEVITEIEPENAESVGIFFALTTQWRNNGMSLSGLDYPALEVVMRIRGVTSVRETFEDVQVLEAEALRVMQVKRDRQDRIDKAKAKQK